MASRALEVFEERPTSGEMRRALRRSFPMTADAGNFHQLTLPKGLSMSFAGAEALTITAMTRAATESLRGMACEIIPRMGFQRIGFPGHHRVFDRDMTGGAPVSDAQRVVTKGPHFHTAFAFLQIRTLRHNGEILFLMTLPLGAEAAGRQKRKGADGGTQNDSKLSIH